MTEVTQTDRECAVRIMADRWNAKHRAGVLAGEHDNWIPVQEVAKHRINHTRPASTEPADALAEELRAELCLERRMGWHPFAVGAARIAERAIAALERKRT